MTGVQKQRIRLAAVGDLLFTTPTDGRPARGLEALTTEVRSLLASCDLVFANLECSLPGSESVSTEPLVVATEDQIDSLKSVGINIVTLANNHAYDFFDEGLSKIIQRLDNLNVSWFGAGPDESVANRPLFVSKQGVSLAFIGAVDESSGPHGYANGPKGGVAKLDLDLVCRQIKEVKLQVDHVIVSPHWGWERYRIPSPQQIEQGRAFVDAGASMVLGHHPHVMQGMERYRGAAIAYSLGNFLTNNVYWKSGEQLTWSRFERTGIVLMAEFDSAGVLSVEQIPVFDDGERLSLDKSARGKVYIDKANRLLGKGVSEKAYRKEKFYVQTVKPLLAQLQWSKLKRVRPGHLGKLWKLLSQQ